MLRRWVAALAVGLLSLGFVAVEAQTASADYVYCDPVTLRCYTVIEAPAPPDPPHNPDSSGFTPGPSQCLYQKGTVGTVEIPCTDGPGTYWSNGRQCYVSIQAPQLPSKPGGAPTGAWYNCDPYTGPLACNPATDGVCRDPFGATFWSDVPPPGINALTPAQAAFMLVSGFQLGGVEIGFAPDPNIPGAKSYVGVPIWMWVNNPQPLTYGPYTQSATLGGVTITATAQVTSILWGMGDGHTVACGNPGTPFVVAYGATDSPTCGYRYSQTSDDRPGGRYTVTATSQWSVTWTGGGTGGTIPLTAQSQSTVEIGELQSVLINGNGEDEG
jgi:hypothetical protein